jgi:UPF0208 membrane protein HI_1205
MSILKTFMQGQKYLETWVLHPKLSIIFPENRVIKATKFAQKVMPFMAVFAIVWQQLYAKSDIIALAAAILTAIFALCIPLQGLYWLGKRAGTDLSPQSAVEFYRICEILKQAKINLPNIPKTPKYQDLAEVLNKAHKHLNDTFWNGI